MLVKTLHVIPRAFGRQSWRCSSSTQVFSSSRESIAKQSLENITLSKSEGMVKDLHALESSLARSAKKQDLLNIKQKWGLKTDLYGSAISLESARQALISELQENLRELNLDSGHGARDKTPHGGIMSAVAASQEAKAHGLISASSDPGRYTNWALGGASLCLCGLALWKLQQEPLPARKAELPQPAEPTSAEPKRAPLPRMPGKEPAEKMPDARHAGDPPRQKQVDAKQPEHGALEPAGVPRLSEALKLGAGLALVLAVAFYFWRIPPGPEGETPLETQAEAPSLDAGPVEASVRARQAAEVVFENAPKESQVWDMSASVRGIKGGVSEKVNMFQR